MALHLHFSSSFTNKPYHHLLLHSPTKHKLSIKSQNSSEPQKTTTNLDDTNSVATPPKKTNSPGTGFGSSSSSTSSKPSENTVTTTKKKQRSKREGDSIIRRYSPAEKPAFVSQEDKVKANEESRNENTFLLVWLGLGALILVEGIALAASGFLPEVWDKFLVKYLYPSFTPTVLLFVGGTVTYGVLKYLQNEKDQK